jgi:hypothetical protein
MPAAEHPRPALFWFWLNFPSPTFSPACSNPAFCYIPRPSTQPEISNMPLKLKPGQTVRVTIRKTITRAAARKTIERLFLRDKAVGKPLALRSRNFKELPKRRGGCIWTKRPNKIHPALEKGASAGMVITPQSLRDLNSVEAFVEVK